MNSKKNSIQHDHHIAFKVFTVAFVLICGIFFIEFILRIIASDKLAIWPPNIKRYYAPDSTIMPGIHDTSFISTNSFGFRTNNEDTISGIKIVLLGGSTTDCLYLDQKETWGELLEQKLKVENGKVITVYNGGRSGLNVMLQQKTDFGTKK